MHRLHALFVLLALMAAGCSREPAQVAIWPPGAGPVNPRPIGVETVMPPEGDNVLRITNVSVPTLTVFSPPDAINTGAAAIICPGGGYGRLAWDLEGTEVAAWLNTIGVTGIILKYRVPTPDTGPDHYRVPLRDAQRAVSLLRARAAEFHLAPDRIGIMGFSAGGHVAANASNNFDPRAYPRVDAVDDVDCRPDFVMLIYPAYLVDKNHHQPEELRVTARTPPTFMVMAEDDPVGVENVLFYYLYLKEAGAPAEAHVYPDGAHAFGLRPSSHLVTTWPARAEEWLRSLGMLNRPRPAAR